MKLGFFPIDFRKKKKRSNIKFHQNPSSGSRVVPCGQTHVMKQSRFSQFCEKRLKTRAAVLPVDAVVAVHSHTHSVHGKYKDE